jgi:hypothetical protein
VRENIRVSERIERTRKELSKRAFAGAQIDKPQLSFQFSATKKRGFAEPRFFFVSGDCAMEI